MRRIAIASLLAISLAACGDNKPDPSAKAAGGEVLEGTISDAMVDLDRSTAQAPIVPAKGGGDDDAKDSAKSSDATGEDEPTPAARADQKSPAPPAEAE